MALALPVKAGYVQVSGGKDPAVGWFARGELGAKFAPDLSAFAFAQADQTIGTTLGGGVRWVVKF